MGRSLGHHHQVYDYYPDPPNRNDKFLSQDQQVKFELDLEAFESHLLNETSKIRDDFSHSSHSPNASASATFLDDYVEENHREDCVEENHEECTYDLLEEAFPSNKP